MNIKHLQITSPETLEFDLDLTRRVSVLRGKHSGLALDLVRELIGDYGAENDPDCYDDGRFVVLADIEIDGKDYDVCYIRNADFMGDNRIAANFIPGSFDFSHDDTQEFLDKCNKKNKDTGNVITSYQVFRLTQDDRPLFVYCTDADDISQVLDVLSCLKRQVFVAVSSSFPALAHPDVQICNIDAV